MLHHHDVYQQLFKMRDTLMYCNDVRTEDLEKHFAYVMKYIDAARFRQAMQDDYENRLRVIKQARMDLRRWPGGEHLAPIDTFDDNVIQIPEPPPPPPISGLWARIFGIRVIINDQEG